MTEDTRRRLYEHGLISIVRGDFSLSEVTRLAAALAAGGVKIVEVTLNTTDALRAISSLQKTFGRELLVGAGTVRTAQDVDEAVAAGASFLIAPCLDLASVERARQHGVLLLPGIFTATEAQAAHAAGCRTVKLFPADALGPAYLKALRAPLDHIDFVPTGGVSAATIADFHAAGAVAFGVGSALVKNVPVDDTELDTLTERAKTLTAALASSRGSAHAEV